MYPSDKSEWANLRNHVACALHDKNICSAAAWDVRKRRTQEARHESTLLFTEGSRCLAARLATSSHSCHTHPSHAPPLPPIWNRNPASCRFVKSFVELHIGILRLSWAQKWLKVEILMESRGSKDWMRGWKRPLQKLRKAKRHTALRLKCVDRWLYASIRRKLVIEWQTCTAVLSMMSWWCADSWRSRRNTNESPSTLLLAKESRFGTPTNHKCRSAVFAIVLHNCVDESMMMMMMMVNRRGKFH